MKDELLTQLQELLATPQLELVARGAGIANGVDGIQLQVIERLTTTVTGGALMRPDGEQ